MREQRQGVSKNNNGKHVFVTAEIALPTIVANSVVVAPPPHVRHPARLLCGGGKLLTSLLCSPVPLDYSTKIMYILSRYNDIMEAL